MTVVSVGVLPRLGLEPGTIGQQTSVLTVWPFNDKLFSSYQYNIKYTNVFFHNLMRLLELYPSW